MISSNRWQFLVTLFILLEAPGANASQEMFAPWFHNGGAYRSELVVHNKRIDRSVTVKPILLLRNHEEFELDPVDLLAKQTVVVDIEAAIARRGRGQDIAGGVVLSYEFPQPGPIQADLLIRRGRTALLTIPLLRRDQIRGTVQEGLVLLPGARFEGSVTLLNTSNQPRSVALDVAVEQRQTTIQTLTLDPRETYVVPLADIIATREKQGIPLPQALRVRHDGAAGDVMVTGAIHDSARDRLRQIKFHDLGHSEHQRVLRAPILLAGNPDARFGFPPGTSFRPLCALSNTSASSKTVSVRVKSLRDGQTLESELLSFTLQPREVRLVDLSSIPPALGLGVLEIRYSGGQGHVIGQLLNIDETTGDIVESLLTSHESQAVSGSVWSAGDVAMTVISIVNATARADAAIVDVFSGVSVHRILVPLAAEGIALVDLNALRQRGVIGDSGSFAVRGTNGMGSALRVERLTVSSSASTKRGRVQMGTLQYYNDEGGGGSWGQSDVRITGISGDVGPVPEPESYGEDIDVTLPLTTLVSWSDGSAPTDESNYASYSVISEQGGPFVFVSNPPSPFVTALVNPRTGGGASATIRIAMNDPCSTPAVFIAQVSLGGTASAYQYSGTRFGLCTWQGTCAGICGGGGYTSAPIGTPGCFPSGQPYLQCFGISVNGHCLLKNATCFPDSVPGYCL